MASSDVVDVLEYTEVDDESDTMNHTYRLVEAGRGPEIKAAHEEHKRNRFIMVCGGALAVALFILGAGILLESTRTIIGSPVTGISIVLYYYYTKPYTPEVVETRVERTTAKEKFNIADSTDTSETE